MKNGNEKTPQEQFNFDISKRVKDYQKDIAFRKAALAFHNELSKRKYSYNFFWLGVPIIKTPAEIQAYQEIVWNVKPDLIIETGIAWGGSIIMSASLLFILEKCDQIKNGRVIAVDTDIRPHNKKNLLEHPLSKKITMLEGSSVDKNIVEKIKNLAKGKRILVRLDSNHTHEHVLAELEAYAQLVSVGSYFIVDDTIVEIEKRSEDLKSKRPWGKGNNPHTAVMEFLKKNKNFKIDKDLEAKHPLTGSPDGFLKRIK